MRELHLDLPPGAGRRDALERALRDSVRSGRLAAGARLPSTRSLALDLGVSRSTVVGAYEQLTAEGYLRSEHGRGTTVADIARATPTEHDDHPFGQSPRWDFRPGEPALGSFPRQAWSRSMRRVLASAPDEAFGLPDPRGRRELRRALADHLARTRSVVVDPAGIFVSGGFVAALGFLAETFRHDGITTVAVEQAMLPFHRSVLRHAGLTVDTIPVDEHGISVEHLEHSDARAVVVTPANQYPFGVTLTPQRRVDLISWADDRNAWIIEDDYDGEFRYDRRPIGALQGLAPQRVIYAGTSSKSLAAGLRIGWLAVPEAMRTPLAVAANVRGGVAAIEQLVLADFIEDGRLDRHIRTMRRLYRARRDELVERLAATSPTLGLHLPPAGLHLLVDLPDGCDERIMLAAAEAHGVGLFGLQTHHGARTERQAIVLGYSRPAPHEWPTALDRLCEAVTVALGV